MNELPRNPRGLARGEVVGSSLRGFGFTFDVATQRVRNWYMGRDGVQRWADDDTPVERDAKARKALGVGG